MPTIPSELGNGNAYIPRGGAGGAPDLYTILVAMVADTAALQFDAISAAAVTALTATAPTAVTSPNATDLASAQTLANELKTLQAVNRTALVDLLARVAECRTAINEIRTAINTNAAVSLTATS